MQSERYVALFLSLSAGACEDLYEGGSLLLLSVAAPLAASKPFFINAS